MFDSNNVLAPNHPNTFLADPKFDYNMKNKTGQEQVFADDCCHNKNSDLAPNHPNTFLDDPRFDYNLFNHTILFRKCLFTVNIHSERSLDALSIGRLSI